MKALFIGYSKCGTKTMSAVFRKLGYKVYDFPENFVCLSDEWTKIFNEGATAEDFKRMYTHVDACVDNPVYHFWEDILNAFPDLKLLVSFRDEDAWLKSFIKQIDEAPSDWKTLLLFIFSPTCRKMARTIRLFNFHIWGGDRYSWPWQTCKGINYTLMRHRYRQHNLYVQERAPKNQLHVVNFDDGWGPICEFLGEPVPQSPFPHLNKDDERIDGVIENSPVFAEMKKEAQTRISIFILFIALICFYLAYDFVL